MKNEASMHGERVLSLVLAFAVGTAAGSAFAGEPVRFIATGDFGEGNTGQYRVAEAMEFLCDDPTHGRGCDFVLGLGDNIYDIGVSGTDDPQFESKFERPYHDLDRPWHMSLGNHDNSHDPVLNSAVGEALGEFSDEVQGIGAGHWYEAGNREVAYHDVDAACEKDPECDDGSQWILPARFYNFTKGEGTVEFFGLDTNTLMYMGVPFPPIAGTLEDQISLTVERQEVWIRKELADSTANWKIAFGHHPYRSNGQHGNAGFYEGAPMTPISGPYVKLFYEQFVCDRVDLLIVGHDHDLQFLKPVDGCGRTMFVVSGAGAKTRSFPDHGEPGQYFLAERTEPFWERDDTRGFFWFEIDGDLLRVASYLVHSDTDPARPDDPPPDHVFSTEVRDPGNVETIEIRKAREICFNRRSTTPRPACP